MLHFSTCRGWLPGVSEFCIGEGISQIASASHRTAKRLCSCDPRSFESLSDVRFAWRRASHECVLIGCMRVALSRISNCLFTKGDCAGMGGVMVLPCRVPRASYLPVFCESDSRISSTLKKLGCQCHLLQPPDQSLRNLRNSRKLRQNLKVARHFLKVALCRQGICIFVSRSGSVWVFSRCLQVFSYFLEVAQSFLKVAEVVFFLPTRLIPHPECDENGTKVSPHASDSMTKNPEN